MLIYNDDCYYGWCSFIEEIWFIFLHHLFIIMLEKIFKKISFSGALLVSLFLFTWCGTSWSQATVQSNQQQIDAANSYQQQTQYNVNTRTRAS